MIQQKSSILLQRSTMSKHNKLLPKLGKLKLKIYLVSIPVEIYLELLIGL